MDRGRVSIQGVFCVSGLLHKLAQELMIQKQASLPSGHSSCWTGRPKRPTHAWPTLREMGQPCPLACDTCLPFSTTHYYCHHAAPVLGGIANPKAHASRPCVHIWAMYPSRKVKPQPVCTNKDISHLPVSACIQVSRAHLGPQRHWQLPWEVD